MDLEGVLSGRGGDRAVRGLLAGGGISALRELLAPLPGGGRTVRACRLRRAHLKPGRKLSGYYDVYVHGEARPVAVAVTWYVGGVPAGAVELAAAAEEGLRAAAVPARFERLWATDPARGMLVLAEPLDPAFPGLGPLSDPARVGEALRSSLGELGGSPGTVRTIRYRPGQRHVLEYRPTGEAPLFIKLYRPGEGGPVAGAVTALADLLEAAAVPRLHAVRPAAVLGDGDALVYHLAPGTPLSRALGAGLAPDATHLAHVGLLLRTVHAAPGPAVPLPERDLGGEVRTVHRACEAMAALRPDLGAVAAGIVDRVHRLLVAIEQEPLTPVHGDMKADHLLWGGQGLHVLDTDRCSLGDPAYDAGKMLADLRVWGLTGAGTHAAAAETAVLAAYATSGARLHRARLYAALLLVRMAARRVPLASPDWGARTAALLASAGRAVDAEGTR